MAEVGQVRTILSGFTGAPGYCNMHFFGDPYSGATAASNVTAVVAFWNGVADRLAQGTTFAVQPDVHVFDEVTGALLRVESTSPGAQSIFAPSGPYAAGVGAVATWNTAAVHGSKQLRGRTFIVPLDGGQYENNGTIGAIGLADIRAAVTTLGAIANFGVWGRPIDGAGGEWSACTGGTVRDHVAWLSSRRD